VEAAQFQYRRADLRPGGTVLKQCLCRAVFFKVDKMNGRLGAEYSFIFGKIFDCLGEEQVVRVQLVPQGRPFPGWFK
jgi:hypothetical protein